MNLLSATQYIFIDLLLTALELSALAFYGIHGFPKDFYIMWGYPWGVNDSGLALLCCSIVL